MNRPTSPLFRKISPFLIAAVLAPWVFAVYVGVSNYVVNASDNDIRIIENFIEWFGTAYSLFLALVLGYVWTHFDDLDREFDLEADALLALHQTCSYISKTILDEGVGLSADQTATTNNLLKDIEQGIVDYTRHVIQYYQEESTDGELKENGEKLLNEIGIKISRISYDEITPDPLVQQLFLKLNEAMDIRGDRIAHSKQRMPPPVWWVALISSTVWLLPFLGLIMDDGRIYSLLAGGAAFVVIMVLIIVKDLDGPFDGAWTVNIDSWYQILEVMEPCLIFVYSNDYKGVRVVLANLLKLPVCKLRALVHGWITERARSSKLKDQFLKEGTTICKELLPVQFRRGSAYSTFHTMRLPLILYRSNQGQYSLVLSEQEINTCIDLKTLKEEINRKLASIDVSFPL